jgi:hypothetical protein
VTAVIFHGRAVIEDIVSLISGIAAPISPQRKSLPLWPPKH